jgi:DNA-binding NarL/FixJ family response regulator
MRVKASQVIRVLVADDDVHVRASLAALIDSEPLMELTDAVCSAEQAIMAAARRPPTVALIDVRMPGGGEMAARGIKLCSPETRVLALSASDDRATTMGMLEAGADDCLVKGSAIDTMVAAIERAAVAAERTGDVISGKRYPFARPGKLPAPSEARSQADAPEDTGARRAA